MLSLEYRRDLEICARGRSRVIENVDDRRTVYDLLLTCYCQSLAVSCTMIELFDVNKIVELSSYHSRFAFVLHNY